MKDADIIRFSFSPSNHEHYDATCVPTKIVKGKNTTYDCSIASIKGDKFNISKTIEAKSLNDLKSKIIDILNNKSLAGLF